MNNDLNISTLVDTLGDIDKRIKELQAQEKQIKDQLKDLATLPDGKKTYIGQAYVVTIASRTNYAINYKTLEADTGLTEKALKAYKTIPSTTLVASVDAI
jgi:conjugal transfer/entry exclusion protein